MKNIWMILVTLAAVFCFATMTKTNDALKEENLKFQSQVAAVELALETAEEELAEYEAALAKATELKNCFIRNPEYRYESVMLTDSDITYAALCAYHEARGESFEGIRAVVEVIFNRILSEEFPNSVDKVVFQQGQFDCASYLTSANITEPDRLTVCYDAVNYVLHNDDYMLDSDYGYFKSTPYTSCSYIQIGNHYFAKM